MSTHGVTDLLLDLSNGKREAVDELLPIIYDELKRIAANYLRRERPDHTLQPTALVHEAYLKFIDQNSVKWENRAHFFGVAAQAMRRILVDHARSHLADKRGAGVEPISIDAGFIDVSNEKASSLHELDAALNKLAELEPKRSRLVELRYFGGLSIPETAEVLGVSEATVIRQWRVARAWLYQEISGI